MKRIIQPNDCACVATVAAMATNTTVEDVFLFLGKTGWHDNFNEAGLYTEEIFPYLKKHGLTVGEAILFNLIDKPTWYDGGVPGDLLKYLESVSVGEERFWLRDPALITVRSKRFEGKLHQVLWSGQYVLDPSPTASDNECLSEYHVSEWISFWRNE